MGKWLMIYDESYIKVMESLKARRKKMYTQKGLAKLLGVTQNTLSFYENCQSKLNLKQFIKICYFLDIDFFVNFSKNFQEEYNNSNE